MTELIDLSSPFASFYQYYLSLLHSKNPDDVSVFDAVLYNETHEDWLIKEGFGTLIMRYGSDIPVSLNCPVTFIDWNGKSVCVRTAKGDIRTTAVIITASTGALDGIKFAPELPQAKQCAIDALPMGNYKHFYGELTGDTLSNNNNGFDALQFTTDRELYFHVRPFGMPYIEASIAGSTADELDKSSTAVQHDFFIDACRHTFGNEISKKLGHFATSQWRKNQWVRGGYAAARPGHGNSRFELAKPLSKMIYFAGEAASSNSYNSAHGAYLSGQRAVQEYIADHGKTKSKTDSRIKGQHYGENYAQPL